MGEAKRRGTFEERKAAAIERDQQLRAEIEKRAAERHPTLPRGLSTALLFGLLSVTEQNAIIKKLKH